MPRTIRVRPEQIGALYVDGRELPYVEFGPVEPGVGLVYQGEDYWLYRTVPLRGYGPLLPRYLRELEAAGKRFLLARFGMRIYIYATGVRPPGAGRAPGG